MRRWERWSFNALNAALAVTGVAYFYMKYLLATDDPFAVVNHPWQPSMLSLHVVVAPVLILCFGIVLRSHILKKLVSSYQPDRRTGWISLLSFTAMALSGYLLQVISSPALAQHVGGSACDDQRRVSRRVRRAPRHRLARAQGTRHGTGPRNRRPNAGASSAMTPWGLLHGLRARVSTHQFVGLCLLCFVAIGSAAPDDDVVQVRVERQAYLMGTYARLVTVAPDRATGLQHLDRMLAVLERTERELSTWDETTPLSRLNRHPVAHPWRASPRLCDLFRELFRWHRETGGGV